MAEISVRIKAIDEATPAMKKMASETSTLRSGFDSLTNTLHNVAGAFGIGLNIGNAIGMVKNMITSSFQLAAAMEQSEMAFTTMLGSAEASTEMLTKLRDFADKTPFEFAGLQEAAKRMMAYGFAAEDVIPTLTSVGDAAAALGGGQPMIERLTTALGQMSAKGKVSGEELRQLAEAGVPALRYLAEAAGVTTGEMSKMIEKGVVPADKAVKVLLENMKQEFGGLMGKQAETASGKLSTMKDSLSALGTEVGRSFIPNVKAGADIITYFANKAKDAVEHTNEETQQLAALKNAFANGYITAEQYASVTERVGRGLFDFRDGLIFTRTGISDVTAATDLLRVAGYNQEREMEQQETRFGKLSTAVSGTRTSLQDLAVDTQDADVAAQNLKDTLGFLSGAMDFFRQETKKSDDKQSSIKKKIEDLTKAHGKNYAALAAGKGTIVDNSREIARAEIANTRLGISLTDLDIKFANQKNIDDYNDAVFESNEVIKTMTAENVNGRVSNEELAEAIEKAGKRLGDHKERLDASFMSQEEYNLEVREGALDSVESAEKLAELNKEHGKGYTAAQLAEGAQRKFNEELGILNTELQDAIKYEAGLQAATATRIKEEIVMKYIGKLAEEGLNEEEIKRVQALQTALGLKSSDAINNMLSEQAGATILDELLHGHALDFITDADDKATAYGNAIDNIVDKNVNGLIPSMGEVMESIIGGKEQMKDFNVEWLRPQSRTIILETVIRRRTELGERMGDTVPEMGSYSTLQSANAQQLLNAANAIPQENERAHGGSVSAGGGPYLVGERGAEVFMPGSSGTIIPNHMLGGGGGSSLNISTVNLYGVQNTSQLFDQLSREARARGLRFSKN